MAGRLEDVEASISWHNEVDIEVDIEASEGPAVACRGTTREIKPRTPTAGCCRGGPPSGEKRAVPVPGRANPWQRAAPLPPRPLPGAAAGLAGLPRPRPAAAAGAGASGAACHGLLLLRVAVVVGDILQQVLIDLQVVELVAQRIYSLARHATVELGALGEPSLAVDTCLRIRAGSSLAPRSWRASMRDGRAP